MSEVEKRYLFHVVHCHKCDARIEVKCGEYRTNKELISEFVKNLNNVEMSRMEVLKKWKEKLK